MPVFYDQLKRVINLPSVPKRIISIVPSQTELLFDLGLGKKIVGITNFCVHPADKIKLATKIGGTKKLNIVLIKELRPDLVIANKEENERLQVEELMDICPVWISDINNLYDAVDMIESIGQMLNYKIRANKLSRSIVRQFKKLKPNSLNLRVAYLIWRKPYMAAGGDTFINSMLQISGLTNAFNLSRYPEISEAVLVDANPDIVFLSSEPYPFNQKHLLEFKALLPRAKVLLVDGEMFSWYGSRLLYAPAYFASVIELLKY